MCQHLLMFDIFKLRTLLQSSHITWLWISLNIHWTLKTMTFSHCSLPQSIYSYWTCKSSAKFWVCKLHAFMKTYFWIGIHPTSISEAFQKAANKSLQILEEMTTPLDLNDRESLLKSASTSLNSKVRYLHYLKFN